MRTFKPRVIEGQRLRAYSFQSTFASNERRRNFRLIIHPLVQLERKLDFSRKKSFAFFWNFYSIHHRAFNQAYFKLAQASGLTEQKFFETVYCGIEALASVDPGHSTLDPFMRPADLLIKWGDEEKHLCDHQIVQLFRLGELSLKLKSHLPNRRAQASEDSKITEQLIKIRYPHLFDELSHVILAYHDRLIRPSTLPAVKSQP